MLYILAVLLPPVAVLLCGRIFTSLTLFVLMFLLVTWPIAAIVAILIVRDRVQELKAQKDRKELSSLVAQFKNQFHA